MSQFYYFTPCCGSQPFGIVNNTNPIVLWPNFLDSVGTIYFVTVGSFSGCVTYNGTTTELSNISIYTSTPSFYLYNNCAECTNIFPCYTPPPVIPPVITGYKNECGVITILPMVVECVVSNPSSFDNSDGEVSVSITGGTPSYITTWWNNGNISPALGTLGNGSYTATTVDYYGDYTATTVCTIFTPKDCTFSASIVEFIVEDCFDNGMSGYTFDIN